VESYLIAFWRSPADDKASLIAGGRYIDRLDRRGDEWRIAVRESSRTSVARRHLCSILALTNLVGRQRELELVTRVIHVNSPASEGPRKMSGTLDVRAG